MTLVKLYFTPALLLLALSCPFWEVSHSKPVTSKGRMDDSCVFYARALLENITDALTQARLFSGINCTRQNMELNLESRTPTVCSPQGSTCSGITTSAFDQDSCLTDIGKDLSHYYKFLSAQPDPDNLIGSSVLYSLRELMEMGCFHKTLTMPLCFFKALVERSVTFNERLSLCKVMKGFHVRTVTINRAIGYMNLGEHAS
uniref:Interleukin-12 subunit alpha-like n=1 Tax=Fundulus heteroclitus TaxID=8078 RepID=A0A3Q2PV26_FUNHE